MVTEAKLVHFRKASLPMEVTEPGMVMEVSLGILAHIPLGTTCTLSPKTKVST